MKKSAKSMTVSERLELKKTNPGLYYYKCVMRGKWFVIACVLLTTFISVYYALRMPNWYAASMSVVPPASNSGSSLSGISSALKDIGLTSKLGSKGGDTYTLGVFFENRTIRDSIIKLFNLAEEYEIPESEKSILRSVFAENINVGSEEYGNYVIKVWDKDPVKARDMVNKYFELVSNLALKVFTQESRLNRENLERRLAQTDSILEVISKEISSYSSRTGVVQPVEQAKAFSQMISELAAQQIKEEINLSLLQKRYGDNDSYYMLQKKVVDELKNQIRKAKTEPGVFGSLTFKNATELSVEYLQLQAQFETFTKVKAFVVPMLEEARLNESKNAQTFIILDSALVPDKKDRPKRSIIVSGSVASSLILSIMIALFWGVFSDFRKSEKE